MRILIDECLDWRLGRALTGHDCVSVQKMGWGGIKNGKLLALAQAEFDVFLTADRNLSFQQNTTKFEIAVVPRAPMLFSPVQARTGQLAERQSLAHAKRTLLRLDPTSHL